LLWRTAANRDNFYRLILSLIAFYQLYPCFIHGLFPAWLDSKLYFMPFKEIIAEAVRSGVMPFWNPYIYCGSPLMANMQSAVFYPVGVLFYVFPAQFAGVLYMLSGSLILSLSLYSYLREKDLSASAAFMASGITAFGYYMNIRLVEFADYHVIAWLPVVLLFSLRHARQGKFNDAILATAAVTMALLAGHPQVFAYCMLFAAVMYIYESGMKNAVKSALYTALGILLALILALPQVASTAEFIINSARMGSGVGLHASSSTYMGLEHITAFFLPFLSDFFTEFTGFMNWAALVDIGAPALILVMAAFFMPSDRRKLNLLAGIFTAALFIAVIGKRVLYETLYGIFPFMASVRYQAKINIIMLFSACMLAAYGLDWAFDKNRKQDGRKFLIFTGIMLVVLSAGLLTAAIFRDRIISLLFDIYPMKRTPEAIYSAIIKFDTAFLPLFGLHIAASAAVMFFAYRGFMLKSFMKPAIAFAAVLFVVAGRPPANMGFVDYKKDMKNADLPVTKFVLSNAGNYRILSPDLYDPLAFKIMTKDFGAALRYLMDTLPPNAPMVHRISNVAGFDSLVLRNYKDVMGLVAGADSPWDSGIFPLFSARYISSRPKIKGRQIKEVYSAATNIYEYSGYTEPVFFVPEYKALFLKKGEAINIMSQKGFSHTAVLPLYAENKRVLARECEGKAEAVFVRQGLNSVTASIKSSCGGYAVFTENWYPGWQATVDGKKSEVTRAYHTFKAVKIPAGSSEIRLWYTPNGFYFFYYAAIIGMILLTAMAVKAYAKP